MSQNFHPDCLNTQLVSREVSCWPTFCTRACVSFLWQRFHYLGLVNAFELLSVQNFTCYHSLRLALPVAVAFCLRRWCLTQFVASRPLCFHTASSYGQETCTANLIGRTLPLKLWRPQVATKKVFLLSELKSSGGASFRWLQVYLFTLRISGVFLCIRSVSRRKRVYWIAVYAVGRCMICSSYIASEANVVLLGPIAGTLASLGV